MAIELTVHGTVQGVFFRAFVGEAAERERVAGWAVNRPDGTVAVRLEGDAAAVDAVARVCERGPERAQVDRVDRADVALEGLAGFDIG